MKKLLSMLLALCMLLSLLPATALAAEGDVADAALTGYNNATLPTAPEMSGDTITVNPENAQYTLDGAYGEINGKTIVFTPGDYGQLELGRATKYPGSTTDYYIGGFASEQEYAYDDFVAAKTNSSTWTASPYYIRNMSNVTLKAEEPGTVKIAGPMGTAGHVYGQTYDYVLEISREEGSAYFLAQNWSNITFENLSFTSQVNIESSQPETEIHGVSFKNCSFTTNGTEAANKATLRYYNENNDGHLSDLTVDGCTFDTGYQGVYTQKIKNVTITNSSFTNTGHNAIAIQSTDAVNHGAVVITNNTFKDIGDRIIRFGNVGADTQITIANNTATNSGDTGGDVMKASTLADGITYDIHDNSWGEGKTVSNEQLRDAVPVAETGGKQYTSLHAAIAAAKSGDTVTLLKNVAITTEIQVDKNLTLNLNGQTLTNQLNGVPQAEDSNPYMGRVFHITGNAVVTVDGTAEGSAMKIAENAVSNGFFAVDIGSSLTLNKGTYTGNTTLYNLGGGQDNYEGSFVYVFDRNGETNKTTEISFAGVEASSNYSFMDDDTIAFENTLTLNVTGGNYTSENRCFHIDTYKLCDVVMTDVVATSTGAQPIIELSGAAGHFENCNFKVEQANKNNYSDSAIFVGFAGTAEITSGTYESAGSAAYIGTSGGEITVKGGTFSGKKNSIKADAANNSVSIVTIEDGCFSGQLTKTESGTGRVTITVSGGYFTSDPSDYVVAEKAAVAGSYSVDGKTYQYQVTDPVIQGVDTAVAAGETTVEGTPTVETTNSSITADTLKADAAKIQATEGLTEQATNDIKELTAGITEKTAKDGLGNKYQEGTDTITIVAEPYLDVQVKAYTEDGADADITKTLTLEITPKCTIKATTGDPTKAEGEAGAMTDQNTVVLKTGEKMTVTETVKLSIPLPDGFVTNTSDKVYVQHDGKYEYTAEVKANADSSGFVAEFENPHGFSLFTLSTESTAVASVDGVNYTSFQDAVDAVEAGGTVEVLKSDADLSATANKTITVKNGTEPGEEITVKVNGDEQKIAADKTHTFTYTAPSYSGGGSSGNSVTISKPTNGKVTVSPSSASKGTTVTLTVKPDSGYVLEDLTVVDDKGNEIELTDKGNGKFTFKMPATKVTVYADFVEEAHVCDVYDDVNPNAWYHDAVDYVLENGLMTGMSKTMFGPNDTTTRGMIVTILYRLEGEPKAGTAAFSDVADGQYYAKAVAWAAKNNIVSGFEDGTFGPNKAITREQFAAILYRYAQYKGLNMVTMQEHLNQFSDEAQISSYAIPALNWAVGKGILSGMNDGALNPQGNATRAQTAQILMTYCENVAK